MIPSGREVLGRKSANSRSALIGLNREGQSSRLNGLRSIRKAKSASRSPHRDEDSFGGALRLFAEVGERPPPDPFPSYPLPRDSPLSIPSIDATNF
jgi:hypothetical protein